MIADGPTNVCALIPVTTLMVVCYFSVGRMLSSCLVPTLIINTSYQKLPFGSGDDPDKLFFHQALN